MVEMKDTIANRQSNLRGKWGGAAGEEGGKA